MRLEWFYVDNLDNSLFLFKNLVFFSFFFWGGGGVGGGEKTYYELRLAIECLYFNYYY